MVKKNVTEVLKMRPDAANNISIILVFLYI